MWTREYVMTDSHALAAAGRALFKELTEAGRPVVGVGIGEGLIYLRVTAPDHGAPENYHGYPVVVFGEDGARRH